jgi:hypothetical protein
VIVLQIAATSCSRNCESQPLRDRDIGFFPRGSVSVDWSQLLESQPGFDDCGASEAVVEIIATKGTKITSSKQYIWTCAWIRLARSSMFTCPDILNSSACLVKTDQNGDVRMTGSPGNPELSPHKSGLTESFNRSNTVQIIVKTFHSIRFFPEVMCRLIPMSHSEMEQRYVNMRQLGTAGQWALL